MKPPLSRFDVPSDDEQKVGAEAEGPRGQRSLVEELHPNLPYATWHAEEAEEGELLPVNCHVAYGRGRTDVEFLPYASAR